MSEENELGEYIKEKGRIEIWLKFILRTYESSNNQEERDDLMIRSTQLLARQEELKRKIRLGKQLIKEF